VNQIPAPRWFLDACETLWAQVAYQAFADFSHNQGAKPWSPETCCMGMFNPAFDNQPGSREGMIRHLEMSHFTDSERQQLYESLAKRGIHLTPQPKQHGVADTPSKGGLFDAAR
jgi:hypothetical protein